METINCGPTILEDYKNAKFLQVVNNPKPINSVTMIAVVITNKISSLSA